MVDVATDRNSRYFLTCPNVKNINKRENEKKHKQKQNKNKNEKKCKNKNGGNMKNTLNISRKLRKWKISKIKKETKNKNQKIKR